MSTFAGISNSEVIPVIDSNLFDNNAAHLAVGVLAVNDVPLQGLEKEYRGYYDLRKNVYVYQTGQLSEEDLADDGTDRDEDDERSIAFGVIENNSNSQRLIATMRLIVKRSSNDRKLPVEEYCPEIFPQPSEQNSIEVSRFISRHEDRGIQDMAKWLIYGTGLVQAFNKGLGPVFAIVEPGLEENLRKTVPITRLGEPRYIPHYLGDNLPISVDTNKFVDQAKLIFPDMMDGLINADGDIFYLGGESS